MSGFLQTVDGDLDLTGGRLTLSRDRATLVATKLRNRFLLFLGEWFMDSQIGVPYFETILVKNPDIGTVRQVLSKVIRETPGIAELTTLTLDFNTRTRTLTFSFSAKIDNGAVISGGSGDPFIITVVSAPTEQ